MKIISGKVKNSLQDIPSREKKWYLNLILNYLKITLITTRWSVISLREISDSMSCCLICCCIDCTIAGTKVNVGKSRSSQSTSANDSGVINFSKKICRLTSRGYCWYILYKHWNNPVHPGSFDKILKTNSCNW